MFCRPTRWCTRDPSGTTISRSSCGKRTSVRGSRRRTRSTRARRRVRALWSSPGTTGKPAVCGIVARDREVTRSLVTTLRAAEKFEASYLESPTIAPLVEAAEVFYVEGFFLTHGLDSVLALSKHASEKKKVRRPSSAYRTRIHVWRV